MGVSCSKSALKKRNKNRNSDEDGRQKGEFNEHEDIMYSDDDLNRMRETLHKNFEMFVLDNLLMSVQFFDNYERDMHEIRWQTDAETDRDEILNEKLKPTRKTSLRLDKIQELIGSKVRFKLKHGAGKYNRQLLHPIRIYLTYDNIEVLANDLDGYQSDNKNIIKPFYKMRLEPCDDEHLAKQGYVNLMEVERFEEESIYDEITESDIERARARSGNDVESVSSSEEAPETIKQTEGEKLLQELHDSIHNQGGEKRRREPVETPGTRSNINFLQIPTRVGHMKWNNTHLNAIPEASSSTSSERTVYKVHRKWVQKPDSDYGYATITSLTRAKPLHESRLGNIPTSKSQIPAQCFKTEQVATFKDKRRVGIGIGRGGQLYTIYKYLNSPVFLANFYDEFAEVLAEPMGKLSCVNTATTQGTRINCRVKDDLLCVLPTLRNKTWPTCAWEFVLRDRVHVPLSRENRRIAWPTKKMLMRIQNMGSTIEPIGYLQTRGYRKEFEKEWTLGFPQAENYLLENMMHSQLRCYLFVLVLYKTYLEQEEVGVTQSHLAHLLFWLVERNCAAWPEDRPGETLKKYMTTLYDRLMKQKLHDYFIRPRNLFESVPSSFLHKVQGKLYKILENPVISTIGALRNLDFTNDFYPRFDYESLYSLIVTRNLALLFNPSLAVVYKKRAEQDREDDTWSVEKENEEEREEKQGYDEDKVGRKMWYNERKKQEDMAHVSMQPRPSIDSIDFDQKPVKRPATTRSQEILKLFILHFLEMAKKSVEYGAIEQAQSYLLHTERLTALLAEENGNREDIKLYRQNIKRQRSEIANDDDTVGPIYEPIPGLSDVYTFHQLTDLQVSNLSLSSVDTSEKDDSSIATESPEMRRSTRIEHNTDDFADTIEEITEEQGLGELEPRLSLDESEIIEEGISSVTVMAVIEKTPDEHDEVLEREALKTLDETLAEEESDEEDIKSISSTESEEEPTKNKEDNKNQHTGMKRFEEIHQNPGPSEAIQEPTINGHAVPIVTNGYKHSDTESEEEEVRKPKSLEDLLEMAEENEEKTKPLTNGYQHSDEEKVKESPKSLESLLAMNGYHDSSDSDTETVPQVKSMEQLIKMNGFSDISNSLVRNQQIGFVD